MSKKSSGIMVKIKSKYKSVAVDTNILIYYYQKHPTFGPIVRDFFINLEENRQFVFTSSITITEIFSYPLEDKLLTDTKKQLLSGVFIKIIAVDNDIALEAARIRREYKFQLADAIQLATVVVNKTQVFITNDQRLKSFKELKVITLSEI
jgi:predicted nucleic acid-binding protein